MDKETCSRCGGECGSEDDNVSGYGLTIEGKKVCYNCCAELEKEEMDKTGRVNLYLVTNDSGEHVLQNWPGTLSFPVDKIQKGEHNIAVTVYTVWFTDHNGAKWWGRQYGERTMICRCKRTKE